MKIHICYSFYNIYIEAGDLSANQTRPLGGSEVYLRRGLGECEEEEEEAWFMRVTVCGVHIV